MSTCMEYDGVAWDRSDAQFTAWKKKLYQEETLRTVGRFIVKHHGGNPEELSAPIGGSFNVCLRMDFKDGASAIIRFPRPGPVFSPEEKVRKEVQVIRLIAEKTSIPVPFIFHYGMTEDSPAGLGPFIIMEYIKHSQNITATLNTPGLTYMDRPILNPNISEEKLGYIYSQMADILLQLSQLSFDQIGSIEEINEKWEVTGPPLTFNMNELVQMANFPAQKLPSKAFSSSLDYFRALASMHVTHLSTQRNDAIRSADDCLHRYMARYLFRKLAEESHLGTEIYTSTSIASNLEKGALNGHPKPFKLFCDDLRPSNVLLDAECNIVGVIDWEFAYAAPAEFTYSPPWWLLIEMPEYWPSGLADWSATYEPRLSLFLKVLKAKEEEMITASRLRNEERLSLQMKKYWDTGDFWVSYAARKSWAIDMIFWKVLNKKFFGDDVDFDKHVGRLSEKEKNEMEEFVKRKLEERKTRTLDRGALKLPSVC